MRELAQIDRTIRPAHREIHERAFAYALWVGEWLGERGGEPPRDSRHPRTVIAWFASLNCVRILRALTSVPVDGTRQAAPDQAGAVKVAMVGLDRSAAAWRELVARGEVAAESAAPCIAELEWLGARLGEVFPGARAFVRPGFDQPGALAART